MNILMVLTSHDTLGDTGEKTGFWLEEFATPFYVFRDAGATVTLASPAGGQPPIDPKSDAPDMQTESTRRFGAGTHAQTCRDRPRRLRRDLLPRRTRAALGPRRGPRFDRADRVLLRRAEAGRGGLSCPGGVDAGQGARWSAAGGRKGRHRFCQQRGGCGRSQRGRTVSRRGRIEAPRRALHSRRRLAEPLRRGRPADHRSKPGLLGSNCEGFGRAIAIGRRLSARRNSRREVSLQLPVAIRSSCGMMA